MRSSPAPAQLSWLSRLALAAIRLYQRHLSPIKGFSCALRVRTGGDSCSAYGYRIIERHGLPLGLVLLRRRLRRCGDIHRGARAARNPVLHHQHGDCDILSCDGCDLPSGRGIGSCLSSDGCSCGCDLFEFVTDWLDRDEDKQRRRRELREARRQARREDRRQRREERRARRRW